MERGEKLKEASMQPYRRAFLRALTAAGTVANISAPFPQAGAMDSMGSSAGPDGHIRDRLWIWGHVEGSHNNQYGLPGTSRMSPAEGAFYLNVPNLIMVAYAPPSEPCKMLPSPPYDPYLISFRPLRRVVWSIVGAGGVVSANDLKMIRQLAGKYPNIVGVQMDDFFRDTLDGGRIGVLTPKELGYVQGQLRLEERKLDLWVTLYRHDLQHDLSDWLGQVDVVTFWTWEAKDLENLEDSFAQAEKAAPRARKVLGCYMWDYGTHHPMPLALMQKQCQMGLDWLKKGRIEGMIFLASCICDLNLEAVEWARNWIRQVGGEKLPDQAIR
jgi:hypothetical protein